MVFTVFFMIGKDFPMLTIWLFMVSLVILKCKLLWDAFRRIIGWDTLVSHWISDAPVPAMKTPFVHSWHLLGWCEAWGLLKGKEGSGTSPDRHRGDAKSSRVVCPSPPAVAGAQHSRTPLAPRQPLTPSFPWEQRTRGLFHSLVSGTMTLFLCWLG